MDFNFDEWARLAQTDPAAFETKRREALLAMVEQGPQDKREAGLRLVEQLCAQTTDTPLERAVLAQNLMVGQLVRLQGALADLVGAMAPGHAVPRPDAAAMFTRLEVRKP